MSGNLPTQHTDTGQHSNMSDFGLMYYNARYYDPALGRFTSADTLIPNPGNPQSWDRYSYVRNSPTGRIDPTGHMDDDGGGGSISTKLLTGIVGILDVDLAKYDSINQFDYKYRGPFGWNACGLVAGSHAGVSVDVLGYIAKNLVVNTERYDPEHGIQPRALVKVYKQAYGSENVRTYSSENFNSALNWMFMQLKAGNIVVVDILATLNGDVYTWAKPETETNTFAHFARVLQINGNTQTITIENTLGDSTSYWTLSLSDFRRCWYNPEVRADLNGPTRDERIGYWVVSITPTSRQNNLLKLPE